MNKFKKDDFVKVTTGKSKGKSGNIVRLMTGDLCIVSGVNKVKKAVKPNPARGISGGFVYQEAAISLSNIQHVNEAGEFLKVVYEKNNARLIRQLVKS